MTHEEFFVLCHKAGFVYDSCGLSGRSDFDEMAYCGEYPCGEDLLKLAELLGVKIEDQK